MKRLTLATLLIASSALGATGRVAGSKHDLSGTGPGPLRAAGDVSPCLFCHVSHRSAAGLSNRPEPQAAHRPYESSTMAVRPGAPSGASRVCLSCHDGTIAVGTTRTGKIEMVGGNRPIDAGRRSNLGTDLRGTHPISFFPGPSRNTHGPARADAVQLDPSGQLQCTSCHDPHVEEAAPGTAQFLRKTPDGAVLCATCHSVGKAGAESSHAVSTAALTAPNGRPTTVAQRGCEACHEMHGAEPSARLTAPGGTDDTACLACHSGAVAKLDVGADVRKPWGHLAAERGVHDAAERPEPGARRRLPEASVGARRHVACVDCHDPHAARPAPATAPASSGLLAGVWGVDLEGRRVEPARFEYEVCLKCHGDSANKPQATGATDRVRRATRDVNLRRVFSPGAPSFHPVAAPGRNALVPGLKAPLSVASMIYCSDCHASESGAGAGGAGPRGPHGSIYSHLLERQYLTADHTVESPASYALCYKCHDREVLLSASSSFPAHRSHVVTSATPCSACHAAHGVSRDAGDEQGNAHLISFDLNIVGASAGPPAYRAAGAGHGSCNVTCHGRSHDLLNGSY
jgi:predicted CXXCH cytochrome family protein